MLDFTDLDKRRLRAAAAQELADRATSRDEHHVASTLAYATRARVRRIEGALPVELGRTVIPARAGLGRIRLRLARLLIVRVGGWLHNGVPVTLSDGDATLTWTARADVHHRINSVMPDFLGEVDQAALDAARAHRAHLRKLPEEHHHPRERENLVRAYRRDYMDCYGAALIGVITLGVRPRHVPGERGQMPALDAMADVRATDVTRYGLQSPPRVIEIAPAS
ncbi:hypothetical protein [Nonomuraea sp. NPDC005650]|uniref:hypothetical protein n=1 Tax=Nonomuraea sp. NPDC005650 TaxID=3157045 RepID=UPI0033A133CD